MNEPEKPEYEPHHFVRSRTPEERNAERRTAFEARQQAKVDAQTKKNEQVKAGTGVRVDGPMVTLTGDGNRSDTDGNAEIEVIVTGVLNGQVASGTALFSVAPAVL